MVAGEVARFARRGYPVGTSTPIETAADASTLCVWAVVAGRFGRFHAIARCPSLPQQATQELSTGIPQRALRDSNLRTPPYHVLLVAGRNYGNGFGLFLPFVRPNDFPLIATGSPRGLHKGPVVC